MTPQQAAIAQTGGMVDAPTRQRGSRRAVGLGLSAIADAGGSTAILLAILLEGLDGYHRPLVAGPAIVLLTIALCQSIVRGTLAVLLVLAYQVLPLGEAGTFSVQLALILVVLFAMLRRCVGDARA